MKVQIQKLGIVAATICLGSTAHAVAVLNPSNNHTYEIFEAPSISWEAASALAISKGGYLATVVTAAENDWVFDNIVFPAFGTGNGGSDGVQAWLGGYQPAGSPEPADGWKWVTDEAWSYANWASGEPNNNGGSEAHLTMNRFGTAQWNDEGSWPSGIHGYVVEYDPAPTTTSVPDGGASALLLGLGFLGAAGLRKKL